MVEDLGGRLRALRRDAGLTQEQLAQRAGMSLPGFTQVERGISPDPHYSTLRQIAEALNITVAELTGEVALEGKARASSRSQATATRTLQVAAQTHTTGDVAGNLAALQVARASLADFIPRWEEKVRGNDVSAEVLSEALDARNALEKALSDETDITDILREAGEYENWRTVWPRRERNELSTVVGAFWDTRQKLFHLLLEAQRSLEAMAELKEAAEEIKERISADSARLSLDLDQTAEKYR
jgi:transcriptional regulator with XRE-family HTH domain